MRGIVLIATALVATVLAHFGLPLTDSDPLRSTLVLLPLIVAALAGIAVWAVENGGPETPPRIASAEAIVLLILVLVTLSRHHLGLRSELLVDRCVAGGFALLLLHRICWLVAALRSTLGRSLPRWAPPPFLALPFVVYLAILPWTASQRPPDGDAPHYLLLTHSLAHDLDTDLANNYEQGDSLAFVDSRLEPQPGDPTGSDGELYSRHNMLLPLVLAPFYRLEGLFGAVMVMAALTATTCWLTLSLASYYRPDLPRETVVVWGILAFTAPLLLFSYQIWVEIPAALLALLALGEILRLRRGEVESWKNWSLLTLSLLLLPLLKIRFLAVAVPLAAMAAWHCGRDRRKKSLLLLLLVFATAVGILWFNETTFDNPLKYHDIDGLRTYDQPPGRYLRGLAGLFFDCAFGLFAYSPIWLLLLPATALMVHQRHRLLGDLLWIFLPYLLILLPRGEWFGAWSPPFRYGLVMLPLLALGMVPLLSQPLRAWAGKVLVALAISTLILTTLWLVIPGWTFNLAHGRSHLLDLLSAGLEGDVARFFPSSTRLRAATFLWPPIAIAATVLLWRFGRRATLGAALSGGVVLSLLAPAAVVLASQQRANRVIEFEDPWIDVNEGRIYPDRWVIYRPRFRSGWILPAGTHLEVPIGSGGEAFDIEIDLFLRPRNGQAATIELSHGSGDLLAEAAVELSGEWTTLVIRDVPWPGGDQPLRVALRGPKTARNYRATLDRARINWK